MTINKNDIAALIKPNEKTCIIVCGATASGKTSLAIELAQQYHTQIISADSRQCFKELNIGVAKPTLQELQQVRHHFINTHSIHDDVTAAHFEQYALQKTTDIFANNHVAIMAGGTGLYINAFCNGLDEIPTPSITTREVIQRNYDEGGIPWLQNEIKNKDALFYEVGEMQNPQRMMRALEVMLTTGNSIISYRTKPKKQRPFNTIKIAIDLPRELLYQRINNRVEEMLSQGLEAEAKAIQPYKQLNALQTVGYKEWWDYFDNKQTKEKTIELIKQNTRHYAKRQLTWFKRDEEIRLVNSHWSIVNSQE